MDRQQVHSSLQSHPYPLGCELSTGESPVVPEDPIFGDRSDDFTESETWIRIHIEP